MPRIARAADQTIRIGVPTDMAGTYVFLTGDGSVLATQFAIDDQEMAWREDQRRVSNGVQVYGVVGLAMRCRPSVCFCGYWQRARAARPAAS
jgi:hypothetical protein